MIDLHTHLLPGIDDGPSDLPGALSMARAAVEGGIRIAACTPHIDHRWNVDPHAVRPAVASLRGELAAGEVALELVAGGELNPTRAVELDDAALQAVQLGEGGWLLLESPHTAQGDMLERVVFELQVRGYRILLAHPERSPVFLRDYERLRRLVARGARCSVTAGSVSGGFGRPARALSWRMLRDGLVHNVASDAHDASRRRPGLLSVVEALQTTGACAAGIVWWLTEGVPAALLQGAELPSRPGGPPPRRRLGWRRASAGVRAHRSQ